MELRSLGKSMDNNFLKFKSFVNTEQQLNNMIWHIENNRGIRGDTRTLDDILVALKGMIEERN